jgi:hypothetical protein
MNSRQTTDVSALFGRLLWMMVGPITLILLALSIVERRGGWLALPSLAYFPVLGGTILGRWLEFRAGHPMTATGEPATTGHLRRYQLTAATLGLAGWIVANLTAITG